MNKSFTARGFRQGTLPCSVLSTTQRYFSFPAAPPRFIRRMSQQIASNEAVVVTLPEGLTQEQLHSFKPFTVCFVHLE